MGKDDVYQIISRYPSWVDMQTLLQESKLNYRTLNDNINGLVRSNDVEVLFLKSCGLKNVGIPVKFVRKIPVLAGDD